MSANLGQSSSHSQEVELNITSIIDCFTVLITFLLASASFLSIGVFEANSAAPKAASSTQDVPTPPVEIMIVLRNEHLIQVELTGSIKKKQVIQAQAGGYGFTELAEELKQLKQRFPGLSSAVVSAEDDVSYESLVMSMERIRKQFPEISFGEL